MHGPTEQMFRLVTGYWVTQAIGVAAKLGVADALAAGHTTTRELAEHARAEPRAMGRLLRALASAGVIDAHPPDGWALTPLGETLRADVPGSMRSMAIVQTSPGHWLPWGALDVAVRTGHRTSLDTLGCEVWEWYAAHPEEAAAFAGAMRDMTAVVASDVARLAGIERARCIVDVGGAHGSLLAAVLRARPGASGVLFDLPSVVPSARDAIRAQGLDARISVVGGDFFEAVPEGDAHLLKYILHDWDDEKCVAILCRCASAMLDGGRIYIIEMMLPDDGSPSPVPFLDLNMLVRTHGRERTVGEYAELITAAGLRLASAHPTATTFRILEAARA